MNKIAQGEIDKLLKSYPNKEFTAKEIANKLNCAYNLISTNLKRMRNGSQVYWRKEARTKSSCIYFYQYMPAEDEVE